MTEDNRKVLGGDLLVKNGKRYEYCCERKLGTAPGFLIYELDRTYLEGWRPHWAPDWTLVSYEHVPKERSRYKECAYPKCCTPVDQDTCGWLPGFEGKRYACAAHEAAVDAGEAA